MQQLLVGDALNTGLFRPGVFDMTITSPPYNVGKDYQNGRSDAVPIDEYKVFTEKWLRNVYIWSKDGGRLAVNVPLMISANKFYYPLSSLVLQTAENVGWKFRSMITWLNTNVTRRTAWGSFMQASAPHINNSVEIIAVFYKGNTYRVPCSKEDTTITREEFIAWTDGIWKFPGQSRAKVGNHPAPYPVELPRRIIRLFTCKNALVFDPFVGSGTTAVAAKEQGRSFVGLDLNENFVRFAKKRLEAMDS